MGPKLEDFEILATIGSGSHGTVRKVRRRQDNQVVVWKELNYGSMGENEKQALVTEVNLLRELRHPNVVKFLHHVVERKNTTLYILMEYCPGGDLKNLISKCRKTSTFLEEGFIWRVLKQVCEVLKVCHCRDLRGGRIILHRDIKPANVFLDANGDVKLGDFGLARTLNSEASFATTFVGTPYYMSPEVINGQEYNEKSDMWSLGCLIYELCALHPPFQATSHKQLAAKIREARYDRIPIQYSSDLQEILGLLLTYEDFLRPTALMILHHSALVSRMSKSDQSEDDLLYQSLNASVILKLREKDRSSSKSTESSQFKHTHKRRSSTTEKIDSADSHVDEDVREESRIKLKSRSSTDKNVSSLSATYAIAEDETENDLVSDVSITSKEELSTIISQDNDQVDEIEAELNDSVERLCQAWREAGKPTYEMKSPTVFSELDLVKPECACGGMSLNDWRERVLALREAEAAVKERELDVKERERDVIHREHRVSTMEREARQHLVRAQIYLKQSRHRKNAATSPHRPPSELNSTVSADIGDEEMQTVAKLDPQQIENPFLKMRGIEPQPEKRVSFREAKMSKFKSNTLDNPKSRRKRGNIFGLAERGTENKNDTKGVCPEAVQTRVPLKPVSSNPLTQQNQKPKLNLSDQEKKNTPSQNYLHQRRNSNDSRTTLKANTAVGIRQRCRSSENLSRRSIEALKDKENLPNPDIKSKKVPEVKQTLRTLRPNQRFSKRDGGAVKKGQKAPTLQFYNIV